MTTKAFVLLSGGIDSTVCLQIARQEFDEVEAISVDYGQRHIKELFYARWVCDRLNIPFHEISLSSIPKSMLTDPKAILPNTSEKSIGLPPTYVPFRNGLMLSTAAALIQSKWKQAWREGYDVLSEPWGLFFGAHIEDQNPDCTPEFIGAMANAILIGTANAVRLHTPLEWSTKADIIAKGKSLGVDWGNTWSCYAGEDLHCGTCPTCRARHNAFMKVLGRDPTTYKTTI